MKRIVTLSGGGAMGIVELCVLRWQVIEQHKPIHEIYDLMIGTSTGAINAALLATGKVTPEELVTTYKSFANKIFTKRKLIEFPKVPLYKRDGFREVWNDCIGENFKMGDVKTQLMITTTNLVNDNIGCSQLKTFKSWKPDDADRKLRDVVEYSFAAPFYFGPIGNYTDLSVYGDGGLFYNLAIDVAKVEAEVRGWYKDDECLIDAIGALFYLDPNHESFKHMQTLNLLGQLEDFFADGGIGRSSGRSEQINKIGYICQTIKNLKFRYWDINVANKKEIGMDLLKNIDLYRLYGEQMAQRPLISFNC